MLDLSGPDVFPKKRNMAGEWSRRPYVREGFLTLDDAACLMAAEGYGGIYDLCSRYTQNEIDGIAEALKMSLDGAGALEGYSPVNRLLKGKNQDVYPLIAFRKWVERTGCGDGRYFAKAVAPGGSAPTGGVPSEEEAPKKSPFQYVGPWAIDKNTPRYVFLSRVKEMTAYEFACLYCGIDPNEQLPDDVYMEYVEPLLDRIAEYAVGEPFDDNPF